MKKEKLTSNAAKTEKDELQKIIERNEREQLLFNTESLIKEPDPDREIEKFELRNGSFISPKDVTDFLNEMAADYFPMFPNSSPFFKLVFKLNDWRGDPNAFVKPPVCALYIKKYVYARFDGDILPYLLGKDNPLMSGYVRKYKLFQFLNNEGIGLMSSFIQDAISVMEESTNWYDFELKYTAKYKLSVQLKCFPPEEKS